MSNFIVRRLDKTRVTVGIWGTGAVSKIEHDYRSTAYVALGGSRIIGALTIVRKRRKDQKSVTSRSTGVCPSRQCEGVGKALWNAMIKAEKPMKITVTTVSNKGYTLIDALKETHKKIKWQVDGRGNHSLRSNRRG